MRVCDTANVGWRTRETVCDIIDTLDMQDATSSDEHKPIGGSLTGLEQTLASRKLAKGLVVSPDESSTSPFIVSITDQTSR